ncbi:MAG: Tm-1-like ATP-binding domain-containing protein [Erysipelotrichaceae bacterium]|nr:Tm-1-like ATP-binding domain-containing protein [Erysipelotrichaceae bacterium]
MPYTVGGLYEIIRRQYSCNSKKSIWTTSPGGPIADPAIDEMMVERFRERVSPNTKLVIVVAAVNDPEFAKVVADEFKILLKAYGWE